MKLTANLEAKKYLAEIGRTGGKSGKGKSKARSSEQARAAALARWEKNSKNIRDTK